ncbi:acyl-CoA dehydrogenase family protein [Candidatus Viadribacter manganicus]|uniref:Acyl-CoA dehydrogenase n=1 Tax=Candidatus Viadribacter manganicus TaxID=1759059 RepID=A0A1B1AIY2_9PROT|nr:acyl-CoA dehydrogenase family protein [Candidatus Viadribacter manganicus]ANP46526.1 acyl-CoA dehydrogenase [Candidatus Viadribacter manganicus]
MSAQLTEDQELIVETARSFAQEKLRPNAARWEEEGLDRGVLQELAGLGFGGIYVGEEHGGSGLSRLDAALIFEELSRGCIATAAFLSIHNMCSWMIDSFGSEEQRAEWLPKLTTMEKIASYCLTEPGSGSDAGALRTTAKADGNSQYVINGSKAFISGAGFSDMYVLMCRTGDDGPKGVSTVLVPNETKGLSFGKNEDKMGWRAQPTAIVTFEDCRVPVENRIGPEGEGFKYAMKGLDGGRLNIAACALGGAQDALDRALGYVKERKQFGKRLADFQNTQFVLADMETELAACRALLHAAARKLDAKAPDATKYCAMAKRFVTDASFKVADQALQLHGGYGYLADYEVERIVRDLRVHRILEGTNEIMRVIVSREMLKE